MGRLLLLVNVASGTGRAADVSDRLAETLGADEVATVDQHEDARLLARHFLRGPGEATVVSAGGGGTLRAVAEAVFDAAATERALVGALRLGSGNLVAKALGIAADPLAGAGQLRDSLARERWRPLSVIACDVGQAEGPPDRRHAVALCGLGQFGRTPGDLARWHRRFPRLRRAGARLLGLERLNHLEYATDLLTRGLAASLAPGRADRVELHVQGIQRRLSLLAGMAMTLPVPGLPDPRVRAGDEAVGVVLVPRLGQAFRHRLEAGDRLEVLFLRPEATEFFLDEDPALAWQSVSLSLAGRVNFLSA